MTAQSNNDINSSESGKSSSQPDINLLFETSWEVCNKVGGIYTVLSTKALELHKQLGDRLVFIGPDVWSDDNPSPVFKENKRLLKASSRYLELPYGITIRTGIWDIPGKPTAVLVNYHGVFDALDGIYARMWEHYKVDSLHAYGDYAESCAFAIASAIVIQAIAKRLNADDEKVVAHFDEWTTGMGLLYLQLNAPKMATVFTTHATSIGRSICGNGKPLYQYFHNYNGDQMASELNMQSKHSLEKAAAHAADCFTTVSDVTADECEQLLEIRPQVITPNGFDASFVPSETVREKQRNVGRSKLFKIASYLTGKQLPDDTFIIATSGRNEFRNKGIDLFLDTMNTLRGESADLDKPVLALVLVPAWVKEPAGELLTDMLFNGDIKPEVDFLTHRLNNEDHDAITCKIRSIGGNSDAHKVTIIDIPCYLDGHDGILDIAYYDLLPAIDLTLFPSYYEPWGYTPLESIAFGVPTITTDKAGFGMWVLHNAANSLSDSGVKVLPRTDTNYDSDVHEAADLIRSFIGADSAYIDKCKDAAMNTAAKTAWSLFITQYDKAFDIALRRRNERINK